MVRDQIHTQNKAKRDVYHSNDCGIGSVEGNGASQNMRRERGGADHSQPKYIYFCRSQLESGSLLVGRQLSGSLKHVRPLRAEELFCVKADRAISS